jgi:hypothetical protein
MLKARLKQLVNACKEACKEVIESFEENSNIEDTVTDIEFHKCDGSGVTKSVVNYTAFKRRWPLSWVPPVHLRHPDWHYDVAETSK